MVEVNRPQTGVDALPKDEVDLVNPHMAVVYSECSTEQPGVTSKPETFEGRPCLAGTRIPVSLVLRYLAARKDPVADLDITWKDVQDCLDFAALLCDYSTVGR